MDNDINNLYIKRKICKLRWLICIREEIPKYWLPYENARLIDNQNELTGLIDIHEGIPDYWLPYENIRLIGNQNRLIRLIDIREWISNY